METGSSYAYRGIKRRNSSNGAIGGNCGYVSGERELEFFVGGGGGGYIGGEGIVANDGQWTSPSWPLFLRGMAAGGTGYVGGVESSIIYGVEAKTIGGNMEIPTYDSLSTMTGNLGNGYAKIMLMGKIN